MPAITIRQLDESLKARLRMRAASHGRSMEEEVREILKTALLQNQQPEPSLAKSIRRRFSTLGGVELTIPAREPMRETLDFRPAPKRKPAR